MASVREIKNDIAFLTNEVISDCYVSLYFKGKNKREEVIAIIEEATNFYNTMIQKANHPADKKNRSLVRKHYAQMRRDMMTEVDAMFQKLSNLCK